MVGPIDLEVYNSIFKINDTNNKFELYTDTSEEFSFAELKKELEEILHIPDITSYHLKQETIAPRIIEAYKKMRLEKFSTDGYTILLMYYARSPFRDFESFLRMTGDLDEDDIQMVLKQNNSTFVKYELDPGSYTIENLQEIDYFDLNKTTKLILTRFGSTFGTLRFDKHFFKILF